MKQNEKKYNLIQKFLRIMKYNFIKLFRSPGGAKKVSLGFALGFGLEMLVISTASLIYVLFIPIVKLAKASLPAAVIGNVIGKLTFLPVLLLPLARQIGKVILPMNVEIHHTHGLISLLHGGIHMLIGMSILGAILGFISYFVIHFLYEKEKLRRMKNRKAKKQ